MQFSNMGYTIKIDATPHLHRCGVKGELTSPSHGEDQNDTMHRPNNNDATQYIEICVSPNAKQTPPYGPKHATLSGGWLGLRAEEGRGKPRYRLG